MEFKQLEAFVAVARSKNFSRAAENLFLTQPTVSIHIQNLEQELDTVLLNRSGKSVSLTEAGELFFEHALEILNSREKTLFSLGRFKGEITGVLEIAASTIPGQYFLPELLCRFIKAFPKVQVKLLKYDSQEVVDKIRAREIDFGIVGSREDDQNLEYLEVFADRVVLAGPGEDRHHPQIPLKDLARIPLILREEGSGTRRALEKALMEKGLSLSMLNVVGIIEDTQTTLECIKTGLGFAFVSNRTVADLLSTGELALYEIADFVIHRKFYFVYHQNRILSPLAETFQTFILNQGVRNHATQENTFA